MLSFQFNAKFVQLDHDSDQMNFWRFTVNWSRYKNTDKIKMKENGEQAV